MNSTYRAVLFLLLSSILSTSIAQSGWVRDKGSFYGQLSYTYFGSDQFFNLSGDQLTTNTFFQHTTNLYAEYGLTNRLTVIGQMPLFRVNQFNTTSPAAGIGDLQLQVKYALLKGSFPVAIAIAPELPTAKGDNFATNKEFALERINLPTGDGEFNVWSFLSASHSFDPFPLYVSAYAGYNVRTQYNNKAFRDQIKYGIDLGYFLTEKIILQANLQAFTTLGDEQLSGDFIRSDGTQYNSAGLGLFYKAGEHLRFLVQAQQYFDGWYGRRNLYSGSGLTIGAAWEM